MPPNSYVFSGVTVVKNLPTNAGDAGSASLIPGSGRPLMEEMATYSLVFLPGKPHGHFNCGAYNVALEDGGARVGREWVLGWLHGAELPC